jgi:hypothetical protein
MYQVSVDLEKAALKNRTALYPLLWSGRFDRVPL